MENPQAFWDARYNDPSYVYGTDPNDFFKHQLDLIPNRKSLLLLAEGEGRNAVYAAQQGWTVTATDFSVRGREKALELAGSEKAMLNYILSDVRQFDFEGLGKWDAIGLIYAHFPAEFRREIHQKCAKALNPGGRIILEAFNPKQLNRASGGPKSPEMLYTIDMLKEDFQGLEIQEAREETIMLMEGNGHLGFGEVVRCVFSL